jgi:hypothetical protein
MGDQCLLFKYILNAPSHAATDQWELVDEPISNHSLGVAASGTLSQNYLISVV